MRYFTHPFQGSIAVLIVAAGMAASQSPGPKSAVEPVPGATAPDPAKSAPAMQPVPVTPASTEPPVLPATNAPGVAPATAPSPNGNGISSLPWNYAAVDYDYHMWFDAGYLLEWFKHSSMPVPLVSAGAATDALPGALGQPHTSVVLGGSSVGSGSFSGMQFTTGVWLNATETVGLDLTYFLLPNRISRQTVSSSGQPGSATLAVPFFDVSGSSTTTGRPGESVFAVAGPRVATDGSIVAGTAGSFSEVVKINLQGSDFNVLKNIYQDAGLRVDLMGGFRWVHLVNELDLVAQTVGVNPQLAGQFFNSVDRFQAVNSFYGGQLAGRVEYRSGAWTFDAVTKVALGSMGEQVQVTGLSSTDSASHLLQGGAFAQPSSLGNPGNIGRHVTNHFAAILDEGLRVGYQPTPWLRLFAGYNFMYISSIVQPGDQIDHNLNSTLTGLAMSSRAAGNGPPVAGPPAPSFIFHESSFWAQGVTLGFEIRY
jgi:Putative beta barrel porin-7 (BBP7)